MASIWDDVAFFKPQEKSVISIRLDNDILAFFREGGDGYQARINAVLKSFVAYKRQKIQLQDNLVQTYQITGGHRAHGSVSVSGSALGATYLLSASLLTDTPILLQNVPNVMCIEALVHLYEEMGVQCSENRRMGTRGVHLKDLEDPTISNDHSSAYFVGSILSMISLLVRGKNVTFSSDSREFVELQYFSNFLEIARLFGVKEHLSFGAYTFNPPKEFLAQTIDLLDYRETPRGTLTATAILFAVKAKGETIIRNADYSPTVTNLCEFLNAMGANIAGIGSSTLKISGVRQLKGVDFSVSPDYLEAYFYATVAVATRGCLKLTNVDIDYLEPLFSFFSEFGVQIDRGKNEVEIDAQSKPLQLPRTSFKVGSYPQYPAFSALSLAVLLATFDQPTTIEGFVHVSPWATLNDLRKFGLDIEIERECHKIIIQPSTLSPALTELKSMYSYPVSVLLAAILAKGESLIRHGDKLSMFYEKMDKKLKGCGVSFEETKKRQNDKA
ncbi:MAG: BrnA antitoxin family protein [Alphaproteobacteria bacterium]|nr:BrnA antitoxin family protein [Alphaproteobacteria bacterium]MBN2779879.1 BrnA antitoxin family protein [Alphaproteobacteria bacterium]